MGPNPETGVLKMQRSRLHAKEKHYIVMDTELGRAATHSSRSTRSQERGMSEVLLGDLQKQLTLPAPWFEISSL